MNPFASHFETVTKAMTARATLAIQRGEVSMPNASASPALVPPARPLGSGGGQSTDLAGTGTGRNTAGGGCGADWQAGPAVGRGSADQRGRGVLEGAFDVLDTVSRVPNGAGLSEVSRNSGLPKATTHRLLEQLVDLGAVQRDGHRYYVGDTIAQIGQSWQPHPKLRRAALTPTRTLAQLSAGAVTVSVLHDNAIRVVTKAGNVSGPLPQMAPTEEFAARTAAGRILLAAQPHRDPPRGYTRPEWKRVRDSLSQHAAVALDHQEVLPGIFCAAAGITLPGGTMASICAIIVNRTPPPILPDLLIRAARETTHNLTHQ